MGVTVGAVAAGHAGPASHPPVQETLHPPGATPQLSDVSVSDLPGSGTDGEPYRISTVSQLQAMEDDLDANYVLTGDIDASATAEANGGAGFAPVGDVSDEFTGQLDGAGYAITGLTIDRPSSEDVGLFGETGSGAVIESVELTDATVTGGINVGSLAGDLSGGSVMRDVSGTVSVTGGTDAGGLVGDLSGESVVRNASVAGTVTGSEDVGGLVGESVGGIVTLSSARATVADEAGGGQPDRAGGLVGGNYNGGVINRSYASGSVDGDRAGGITGSNYNSSRVADTYAVGSVNGTASQTGGVVGVNTGDCPLQDCENFGPSTVTDSYWDTEATGQTGSDGGTGLPTAEMRGSAAGTNMTGLDFDSTWRTVPGDYPELIVLAGGSGSAPGETEPEGTRLVLEPESATVTTGGTTTFEVVLTNADGGVRTYSGLTVSVGDTGTASVAAVSDRTGAGADTQTVASDGSSATISAQSGGDTTDTGDVPIASVDVAGEAAGTTDVTLRAAGDVFRETGSIYEVSGTRNSSLTVRTGGPEVVAGTPASDTDGDGLLDDFNGNGQIDRGDAQALFSQLGNDVLANNTAVFDRNDNGQVDRGDVQALFTESQTP